MPESPVLPERRPYGKEDSQFVDLYQPAKPRGTIVSIHGGYWRAKYGLDLHDRIARHLASCGWTVANIEYRRVEPDRSQDGEPSIWHAMSSDILDAIASLDNVAAPIITLGHSAGGQLALWAAAQPGVLLAGVIGLAPLSDLFLADGLQLSEHATLELFGADAADRPDLYATASPLHLLPLSIPQLIVHGHKDEDVPYEMAPEYIETAELLGDDVTLVDPKAVDHFDVIDPSHAVWREIDAWLEKLSSTWA